jgi:tRNA-Thr(GGU) m(6)t(6)A37 methyltransferase TsaA
MKKTISLNPLAWVSNSRQVAEDDHWDSVISEITLDDSMPDECLEGIEAFSHFEVLFYFDKLKDEDIVMGVRHPRGNTGWPKVGIFAQRGRARPNKLGLCIVKLISKEGRKLKVLGLDAIDGTPILDIKPVMKEFLPREEIRQPEWSSELMKNYW